MSNDRRLIEVAFPLKQASIDSVHEKNVRHGHISTLHIWPARRPLAASRAALIATLLPAPEDAKERSRILERLGGTVVKVGRSKKLPGRTEKIVAEETLGGILHWGREANPDLTWFRDEIKKAFGGRPPRVLDPFAGGGAIPLEAMRLGCEVTAADINPVAWLILKGTLHLPHRLVDCRRALPDFALDSQEFMQGFFRGTGRLTHRQLETNLSAVQARLLPPPEAEFGWHIRAWAWWVLQKAKASLEDFYPTPDGKPVTTYLWARTVTCKNCRATIPLLKTRWLCKKDNRRVLLSITNVPDGSGVTFGIEQNVPKVGGNAAQRREHDKRIGMGTMTRSGATCPNCSPSSSRIATMTMEDLRLEGRAKRLGMIPTAVVVEGADGKDYRIPFPEETEAALKAEGALDSLFSDIPFGLPNELLPAKETLGFRMPLYGFAHWSEIFTSRQLLALGTFVKYTRQVPDEMRSLGYEADWIEAVTTYLAICVDRLADRNSTLSWWQTSAQKIGPTFTRWALPMTWDFAEICPWADASGGYLQAADWVSEVAEHLTNSALSFAPEPKVRKASAVVPQVETFDCIVTDPPYYDAIPYSDLMDFYYIWLKRSLQGLSPEINEVFQDLQGPKWDEELNDGELIDDSSRFGGIASKSKAVYEDGMFRAFRSCSDALEPEGRLVIVFAHKQPDAWETLVSAIIRAGFVVDGSWPIQTERVGRIRSVASAALSSSVWLVCRKRPVTAKPGWDNGVLEEMRKRIEISLREFWDAGIRGPDFVWAATGPALEAYSQHPVVKKANDPGELMKVSEFLQHVRRMVVDFVVGRVLSHNGNESAAAGLDDITTYYLLHRNDFGMEDAPIGACILYAISCGLSDKALVDQFDILTRTGGREPEEEEEVPASEDSAAEMEEGTGSKVRIRPWQQRKRKTIGYEAPGGGPIPLIDQVHRVMHLWKGGDVTKVNEYLDAGGLRHNKLFHQLLQALIELATAGGEERALLESISNHVAARGSLPRMDQPFDDFQAAETREE